MISESLGSWQYTDCWFSCGLLN